MITDLDAMLAAHERVTTTFAGLLGGAPADIAIPHLAWTAGELGAHVLGGTRAYERAARAGTDIWTDLRDGAAENARQLSLTPERDPAVIADRLAPAVRSLHDAWRSGGATVHWSGGLTVPIEVAVGVNLADVLVHSWDLSRATKHPFKIDRGDAIAALRAVAGIAPYFVAPDAATFTGCYEVRLRGDGAVVFAFDKGVLHIDPGDARRIDCRLSADPAAFLLASYGRIPVWRPALTGAMIASGRKPWLAFRFKSLLVNP